MCRKNFIGYFLGLAMLLLAANAHAQCPGLEFYGSSGNLEVSPVWWSCTGTATTLTTATDPINGNYTIDWGDGSPLESFTSLPASHNYALAVDTFPILIHDLDNVCTVTGLFVMEQSVSASISIPISGVTEACAPQAMQFINASTDVSPTTIFTWDFGDGSPIIDTTHVNAGETMTHTYLQGTVDCETAVILTAANYCTGLDDPSSSTFDPIKIWDLDQAAIGVFPSASICWPDNEFTFNNASDFNCENDGNTEQRYEYWNFGDYWGQGSDSIIDWTAIPPIQNYTIAYPDTGNYEVMMVDQNQCGNDTAWAIVSIVLPPQAGLSHNPDPVCVNSEVTFTNSSSPEADAFSINYDDGAGWNPVDPGNFTHTFTIPGTYDVELAGYVSGSFGACADTTLTVVTVQPGPVPDFTLSEDTLCGPGAIDIIDNSSNADNWSWNYGNGVTSTIPIPTTQNYPAIGVYPITLDLEATNGCTASAVDTLVIHDLPEPDFNYVAVCEGDTIKFADMTLFSATYPITYYWEFGDGATSTDQHPDHIYAPGLYTITLTVDNGFCTASTTADIEISDGSQTGFNASITEGCAPLTVDFTNLEVNANNNWSFGDGYTSTDFSPSHTFNNTGSNPQNFTVSYFAQNSLGCYDTTYMTITAHPKPNANFLVQTGDACEPLVVNFSNISQNADSYLWTFEPGETSTLINPPDYVYLNESDTLQVVTPMLVATSTYGCVDTLIIPINVNPLPTYEMNLLDSSGCSPLTVEMPAVPGASSFNWDFGNGLTSLLSQPIQQFINTTGDSIVFDIFLEAANSFGCTDTATSQLVVYPSPIAQFLPNTLVVCSPETIDFTDNSVLATDYEWDFGDGSNTTDPGDVSHEFTNTGNAPITYPSALTVTSEDGCSSTTSTIITVFPEVVAAFDADTIGCTPFNVNYTNNSTGDAFSYWSLGDGSLSLNDSPNYQYINPGVDNVVYPAYLVSTSSYGCRDTSFQDITVHPAANAFFQTGAIQGCSPLDLPINNTITFGSTYAWNYGNGNTSNNGDPTHNEIFLNNTNTPIDYTISLETTNIHGCTATAEQDVEVLPGLEASFDVNPSFCSNVDFAPINNSTGSYQYIWDFGDGYTDLSINPIYSYENQTGFTETYDITLTAESTWGCSDDTTVTVEIFTQPIAAFSIDSSSICHPLYLELGNNSSFGTTYYWDYGDGNSSINDQPTHAYTYTNYSSNLLTNTLELTVATENGCTDIASQEIQVIPELIADFVDVIPNCSPMTVNFENSSVGALEYQWMLNSGELSAEDDPTYIYINNGITDLIFPVTLIANSYFGCSDTITQNVLVHPQPVADFNASPGLQTFPEATIDIDDLSLYGNSVFTWNMGDGMIIDSSITAYTYMEPGVYDIVLTIDNGQCSDEEIVQVTINDPVPIANFIGEGEGCVDLTIDFINLSEYGDYYLWSFGDGGTSEEFSPSYTYENPGDYTVSLFVSGIGGSNMNIQEEIVHAYPNAVAEFTVNPALAQIGDEVFFFNLSQDAGLSEWDFGNGATSTANNPTMVFSDIGDFDVTLISNNIYDCPDTLVMDDALKVELGGFIQFPNAFTPNPDGPINENYNVDVLNNDLFFPIFKGVEKYHLMIYNRWGELVFETFDKDKGWNGYYLGQLAPLGVYVWKADVTFTDGKEVQKAGDLTLLR